VTAATASAAPTPVATAPAQVRRGRPRRADADAAILTAALELVGEAGIGGLSMDQVAQRAGVGKATIYRRWASKESLILDALRVATTPIPVPDEGDLRADLIAYTDAIVERFGATSASDVLPHLIAASCYDEPLRASLEDYTQSRQATLRRILRRGIERGELPPDTDVNLLVDLTLGPFFYRRLLSGATVDRRFSHRLVDAVLTMAGHGRP
jgi:AcrR family transcriptional regulator